LYFSHENNVKVTFGGTVQYDVFELRNVDAAGVITGSEILLDSCSFDYDTGNLRSTGSYNLMEHSWHLSSHIDGVTIASDSLYLNLGGKIDLNGNDDLHNIDLSFDLHKIILNNLNFNSAVGNVSFDNGRITNTSTIQLDSDCYSGVISSLIINSRNELSVRSSLKAEGDHPFRPHTRTTVC